MGDELYETFVREARRTNDSRDDVDRRNGFGTPADGGPAQMVAAATEAIRAGLREQRWDFVAEGLVLLDDAFDVARAGRGDS